MEPVLRIPTPAPAASAAHSAMLRFANRRALELWPGRPRIVGIVNVADSLLLLTTELANIAEVTARRREPPRK